MEFRTNKKNIHKKLVKFTKFNKPLANLPHFDKPLTKTSKQSPIFNFQR